MNRDKDNNADRSVKATRNLTEQSTGFAAAPSAARSVRVSGGPLLAQVRTIAAQVRAIAGDRSGQARGTSILVTGSDVSQKTLAAETLARELQLGLYRVDLSAVIGKYIGETEKNIDRLFGEAEQSGNVLFFDEADALLGRRTDVKDSHDRYASTEVDYLLQRIEQYSVVVIFATSRKQNIDEGFIRRLRGRIDLPD